VLTTAQDKHKETPETPGVPRWLSTAPANIDRCTVDTLKSSFDAAVRKGTLVKSGDGSTFEISPRFKPTPVVFAARHVRFPALTTVPLLPHRPNHPHVRTCVFVTCNRNSRT
jgi:hypothetical protein